MGGRYTYTHASLNLVIRRVANACEIEYGFAPTRLGGLYVYPGDGSESHYPEDKNNCPNPSECKDLGALYVLQEPKKHTDIVLR